MFSLRELTAIFRKGFIFFLLLAREAMFIHRCHLQSNIEMYKTIKREKICQKKGEKQAKSHLSFFRLSHFCHRIYEEKPLDQKLFRFFWVNLKFIGTRTRINFGISMFIAAHSSVVNGIAQRNRKFNPEKTKDTATINYVNYGIFNIQCDPINYVLIFFASNVIRPSDDQFSDSYSLPPGLIFNVKRTTLQVIYTNFQLSCNKL
jgi:hypothetical protein